MSKLLIVSDSFSEDMAVLSYPDYKHMIEADEIVLLKENHTAKELKMLNTAYPVGIIDCIDEFDGDKLLVLGDDNLLQKISSKIELPGLDFMLMPSPYNYSATDLSLNEIYVKQFSALPTILVLTFSNCSNIVNVELFLEKVFREKGVEIERHYMDKTGILLDAMYEIFPEDESDYFYNPYQPQVVIKSVFINEQVLKKSSFSQIVAYFEKINPDYTVLCLDADLACNETHCEIFTRIFGKMPNTITHSPYYEYQLRKDITLKVFSNNSEKTVINELTKQNEWANNIFAKISLPRNMDIL